MDPDKMAAYDVTPSDIRSALGSDNIELPSGGIEGDDVELTIRTMGRMTELEEFDNLIIRAENGSIVRFQVMGRAELGTRDDRTVLKRSEERRVGKECRSGWWQEVGREEEERRAVEA